MFIVSEFDNRQFADNLATLRERAEFSIDDLATRVGVSPDLVERWEEAEELPSEAQTRKLEEALDWPLVLPPRKLVTVKIGDWEKLFDERLAPLAREMLIAGFPTILSFVDNLGVTIGWPHPDRAALFLNIVTEFEKGPDTMYNRVNEEIESTGRIPKWKYELTLTDANYDDEKGVALDSQTHFGMLVTMQIPPHDLPAVVERLKTYNEFRASKPTWRTYQTHGKGKEPNRRVYFQLQEAKGIVQYNTWGIPVSFDTARIANIPVFTDEVAYRDLVRVSPNGDFMEVLERLTRTRRAKYVAAANRKDAERQWQKISKHFEDNGVECELAAPGLFMMAVSGNVTDERFLELWKQSPIPLQAMDGSSDPII